MNSTLFFQGSTYTSGFTVNGGTLMLASSSVLKPSDPTIISNGPVGVGTLTLGNNATITTDGAARTLHNAVSVPGDFAFGLPDASTATSLAASTVTLAGPVTLQGAGNHSIGVNGPLNVATISGLISGTGATLTKTGTGTLILSKVAETAQHRRA